ncbi:DUF2335 domain-containing protein [Rickettsiales endosymbiont of Paramecium tredecaurelia]|uniref:hypothetical protein n=1 Tax=Candidatus Sarmatiella mevalonica TaxID=2770581 RepID=UPI0019214F64|nr:hypothetical protein [Candidatus Sarmatiella mevalonica]MBL3284239.1 DUF2335 domain-containing protein [Candidatus Sarmatiella mevalonica]
MKRKFYFDNNTLNKGYKQHKDSSLDSRKRPERRIDHILPPIEVIDKYEEFYPGTLKSLIEVLDREQKSKHEIEIIKHKKAKFLYILISFVVITVSIIFCFSAIYLTYISKNVAIAFLSTIIALSVLSCVILRRKFLKSFNNKRNNRYHFRHSTKNNKR